ncbi:MAG: rhamnulokinase [Tannerella sp.]|jgi:rhamnulokinase|nr:rhamnulokinase [Tannerella sp.]
MNKHYFLAFDLGATSGRSILGILDGNNFEMRELTRFSNTILEVHGKYYWNIFGLYNSLKEGLMECAKQDIQLTSIGIDTWGVDFGYVGEDGTILGLPRAYRDPYTDGAPEAFFEIVPREKVYAQTGIQIMNFNSLYQLFAAKRENFSPLNAADKILFMPDLLSYLLTGKQVCEYTEASTSQILNPETRQFETSLLEAAGVKTSLLNPLIDSGTVIGTLTDSLAEETGIGKVPVVAVAGHDTASAVLAVPADNQNFAYLSSGTWSLMGVEIEKPILTRDSFEKNFTNEGGIEGTTRFLKNITGMWLLEQCRREWEKEGRKYTYTEIVKMAENAAHYQSYINPDDPRLANPVSMSKMIATICVENGDLPPASDAEFVRCIFESLTHRYKEIIDQLSEMISFPIEKLHIIGGGSQNKLINQMTANLLNIPVIAGPSEATAIGNCMMQAKAAGLVKDRWEIRKIIAKAFAVESFLPHLSPCSSPQERGV